MWGIQEDTRRRIAGGMTFLKRRIMEPHPVNVGGKIVKKWTGWYQVETYDASTGLPLGQYLCPPSYEDFAGLYQGDTLTSFDDKLNEFREVGEDIHIDFNLSRWAITGSRTA
jgi:hypothetical protein